MEIKVGYLVAYDYAMLKNSLPTVYATADKIVLAIDKDRKTFAGETFTINADFFTWLTELDTEKKIHIYEDGFFVPGMSVRDTETRKRNMLARFMGDGGWHFQIDVDEYFVDFHMLVEELRTYERELQNQRMMFRVYWRTIFKITPEGFYLIEGGRESFPLVTNYPVYEAMRYNHTIENRTLNHVVLHQSFGRSEEDLWKKFRNWSHADDFDSEAYFNFWKSVNSYNYKYIYDFNATHPGHWMRLQFVKASSVEEVLKQTPSQLEINDVPNHPRLRKWLPPVLYDRLVGN